MQLLHIIMINFFKLVIAITDYKLIEDEASWARGEPSDMGILENYLQMMMKRDYKWNDANGDDVVTDMNIGGTVNKFICECRSYD